MFLSRSSLVRVLAVLAVTAMTLLATEGIFRLIGYPSSPTLGWRWDVSAYKSPENFGDKRVNQLGLRGRPIQYVGSDYVILLVGDSFIEAGVQPFADMPEQILEDAFRQRHATRNVRVFSIAAAGWAQDQELVWLKHYFQGYRADLVVNFFTPVNDYWENSFIDRSTSPHAGPLKPTYRLAADGKLEFVADPSSPFKILELVRRSLARIKAGSNISLENIYMHAWNDTLPQSNLVPAARSDCPNLEVLQADLVTAFRSGEGKITVVTSEDVPAGRTHYSPFMIPRSDREAYQIALTHRLLAEMQRTVASRGADFRVFYPRSDIDLALQNIACVKDEAYGRLYRVDMRDLFELVSTSELAELAISVDVASSTPTIRSDQDWHLNRAGNEKAMGELADALMRAGKIK